jgi:hypothetical protein
VAFTSCSEQRNAEDNYIHTHISHVLLNYFPCHVFFSNFVLILSEFHPMRLISLSPHTHSSLLQPPSTKNEHTHTQAKKTSHHGSCSMLQCAPQYISLSKHLHLQMFIAMSPWSGSMSLALVILSILDPNRTPPGYPVASYHVDPSALDQQDWPFHMSQPNANGIDFGVGQLRALHLSLGGSLTGQLSLTCTTKVSFPALLWADHPMPPSARGQVSSPALMPLRPAHLHPCLQSQLYTAVWEKHRAYCYHCWEMVTTSPEMVPPTRGLSPLISPLIEKMPHSWISWRHFLNWSSFFSDNSSCGKLTQN